jgi:hypothetical protein
VSELALAGWDLTTSNCNGGTPAGTNTLALTSIDLLAGQTITCTFTNVQRGLIRIVKTAVDGNGLFNFDGAVVSGEVITAGFANFALDTVGGTAQTDFVVKPGTYTVAEDLLTLPVPPSGHWEFTDVSCVDPTTNSGQNGVTPELADINVAPGETVICTFVNTLVVPLEACSPGYWRQPQHFGSYPWDVAIWGSLTVVPIDFNGLTATEYGDVFSAALPDWDTMTFPEAIGANGGGFNILTRHSGAAYLNSVVLAGYGLTPAEVVALTNAAWIGGVGSTAYHTAINAFTELLEDENCTLGRSTIPGFDFGNGLGGGIGNQ